MWEPWLPPNMRRRCRLSRRLKKFAANWIAGHDRIGALHPRSGVGKCDCNGFHEFREHPIREARKSVLLVNGGRKPLQARGEKHRARRVAADAENGVGSVLADDAPRLRESDRQTREVLDQVEPALPLQTAHRDVLERKAGLRHDVLLEAVVRADENDTPPRIARHELLRDRDRRVDVAPRATTRDHQHATLTHVRKSPSPTAAKD